MRKKHNLCSVKGCYEGSYINYYTYPICLKHWLKHCDSGYDLKKALNIPLNEKDGSEAKEMRLNAIQAKLPCTK